MALRLRKPRLSAEAHDITIPLPVLQLPCIHYLLPLGEEKMQAELVAAHGTRGLFHQLAYHLTAGKRRLPYATPVETKPNGVDRVNIHPFCETWLIAQQPIELSLQRIRQRVGKRRQKYAGVGMGARQMSGVVVARQSG